MDNIIIRRYNKEDKNNTLSLLKYKWESLSLLERIKKFEWRYYQNPVCDTPYIYLAFTNKGYPIGMRGFVPYQYYFNGQLVNVYMHSDTIIHPKYRGRGVYSQINEFTVKSRDFEKDGIFLNLSSSPQSLKGYYKYNWINIGLKQYYFRFSFFNLVKNKISSNKHLNFKEIELINGLRIISSKDLNYNNIENFKGIDKKLFRNKLTKEYLSWRYSEPGQNFVFTYLYKKSTLLSFAFYKISAKEFQLMDFNYLEEKNIIFLIKNSFQSLAMPILRLFSFEKNNLSINMLCKAGFITNQRINKMILNINRTPVLYRKTPVYSSSTIDLRIVSKIIVSYSDVH